MKNIPLVTFAGALLACALIVLSVSACKKSAEPGPAGAAAPSGAAPAAPAAEDTADHAEGTKLHAAIECLNRHSANVVEARVNYLKGVDAATGSSHGKKPIFMGLYGIDPCLRDIKEAGAVKPAVPALDDASAAYASALEGLVKAWEELGGYYQKGEYLDDGGKKAAALHPKVMDAFKTFAIANKELSATVKTLNRKRRVAKLAAREKAEGRNLSVIMDSMMLEAETLIETTMSRDVSAAALDPQIATVGKLIDEVDAYAGAHKDEERKWGSMANIKNYDKTFLAATKVIARKLRDKAKPTDSDFEEVNKQYNSLVDNYNRQ
jgi:hypothetical protein